MANTPARFRQAEIARVIRAAQSVGLRVEGVELRPDGTFTALTCEPDATPTRKGNPLDRLL